MASRRAILTATSLAIASIFAAKSPCLVWNVTASAPVGLYAVSPAEPLRIGELVLAEPPASARQLAANRGYLPEHVPLVKRIAALERDRICSIGNRILIDDRAVAIRLAFDTHHRPLPAWYGCRALGRGEVFLLMADVPDSFDGRYFGPVERSAILGKLRLLWRP
ncbi:MAG: S26 family signal peptidase [Alphaproteobacteria bacterium]|nr:S26 family signal peptidase [Alphaproteobacteria bacterium]MDE2111791.1 S26 family signal peptidase [Alphaproteobacteria bacterium]